MPVDNFGQRSARSPTLTGVTWDRFLEDLEDQFAAEWESERAALDSEAERLRISRLTLRERLAALAAAGDTRIVLETEDGSRTDACPQAVGADWIAAEVLSGPGRLLLVPLEAIQAVSLGHGDLLLSARSSDARDRLAERITFPFALRDLARRRVTVTAAMRDGRLLTGTVDRVGADHVDLALHDLGSPRRAAEVTGYRMIPLAAVAWVRTDASAGIPAL